MKEQRLIRILAALLIALVAFTAGAAVMKLATGGRLFLSRSEYGRLWIDE